VSPAGGAGTTTLVGWEPLFEDLDARLEAADSAELTAEVADRTRRELGAADLVGRLRPAVGSRLRLAVLGGGGDVVGRLTGLGPDWLLLAEGAEGPEGAPGRDVLVVRAAVQWVVGLPAGAAPADEGPLWQRLDLRHALRGLVRDRAAVQVGLTGGHRCTGTLDRVGADFVDLAEHPPDEVRRRVAVRAVRTLPLSALAVVRRM
jgi:hypothetical protein